MQEVKEEELSLSTLAGHSKNLSFNYGELLHSNKNTNGYYNSTIDADKGAVYNPYWIRNTNWSVQIPPVELTHYMAAYISNSPLVNWDPLTPKDSNQSDFDYIYEIAKKTVRTAQKRKRDLEDQVKKYTDECIANKKKREEELENLITIKKKEKHKLFQKFQEILSDDSEEDEETPSTSGYSNQMVHSYPRALSQSSSEDIGSANVDHQYGQSGQSPHSMEESYPEQNYDQYFPDTYPQEGYPIDPYAQQIRGHQPMHSYPSNIYDSRSNEPNEESHRIPHHSTGLTIQTQGHGMPPRGSGIWQQQVDSNGRRQPLTPQTPRPPQTQPRYVPIQDTMHSYGHRNQNRGPSSHRRHQEGSRHSIGSPTGSGPGPRGISGRGSPRRLGPSPISGSHPSHILHTSYNGSSSGRRTSNPMSPRGGSSRGRRGFWNGY